LAQHTVKSKNAKVAEGDDQSTLHTFFFFLLWFWMVMVPPPLQTTFSCETTVFCGKGN